jgi:muramoyltetrapeptide carboxypeptidase
MIKFPPRLKKGQTIGITCPAGYMAAEKAETCITTLQQWGFHVMVGKTLGSQSVNYFSGTDDERLLELQAMLDSDEIDAILFGRGGYGLSRIIDKIDFTRFRKKPKWLIGYSDITVLHAHIHTRYKTATLHSPMAAAFNDGEAANEFVLSLQKALMGKKANYHSNPHLFNQNGKTDGQLVGGNLCMLAHLTGTNSQLNTKKKILFIEDIGEYIYNIDRMLWQLKRSGQLDNLAGLVVGGFRDTKDTERPFGQTVEEVIHQHVKDYPYPVCFNFPVSHSRENYVLKVGGNYQLTVNAKGGRLKEI